MKQRIFVGLSLPDPLPAPLAEALKKLRTNAGKSGYSLKWTEPGNHHVTLKFIGETERGAEIIDLVERLAQACAPGKLALELHGFGAFPNDHEARVVWAGVRNKKNLRALQLTVEEAFTAAGFPPEPREFHPHITLARVRSKQSLHDLLSPFVRKELGEVPVAELTVFESVVGGAFPRYVPLARFPLP